MHLKSKNIAQSSQYSFGYWAIVLFFEFFGWKSVNFKNVLCVGILVLLFINVNGQTSFSTSVASSTDDIEEAGSDGSSPGNMYPTSADLEMTLDAGENAGTQKIGIRFTGITIPRKATITNAYITFRAVAATAPNTNSGVTNLIIRGQAADNPGTFLSTAYDVTNRPTTSASTAWSSIPAWTTGVSYNTVSFSNVVQELVNRSGWSSGNSMVFIITGTGHRSAEAWDDPATNQPILTIVYTTLSLSANVTNVSTTQGSDGAINLTPSSGTAPYAYSWSNSATTQNLTGLSSGTYTVTVTDANGATASSAITVLDGFVKKQLYLSGSTQLMDREDPVSVSQTLKSSATLVSPAIGVLNAEYRAFDESSNYYGTYTSPDGPDRMLLVCISVRNLNSVTITNVTYNGLALTQVASAISGTDALVYIFRLLNPPVGTYYLDVNFNSNVTRGCIIGIQTLHGVHQTTPTGTATTSTTTGKSMSVEVASVVGDLVVGVVAKRNASGTFTTPQTQRWNAYLDETRGGGNSEVATTTSTTLSWTSGVTGNGNAMAGVAIKQAGGNATTSFTQSPAMCSNFVIKGGPVTVKNYINIVQGTMPASPNITAVLKYDAVNIITLTNPSYNSATGILTWTGTLPSDVTVPAGKAIVLDITTNQTLVKFQIQYDHSSAPSMVELTTSTYIDMPSMAIYSAANPGGSVITTAQANSTVYVRTTSSDPFGFTDITAMNVNVISPASGPFTATSVATSGCTRTHEYAWTTPSTGGDYTIKATAKEGYENTVSYFKTADIAICPLTVSNSVTHLTSCVASNGAIALTLAGSIGPYTYSWNRTSPSGSGTGSGTNITGLAAGIYTITVTSSKGCTGTTTATINAATPPGATGSITNVTCFGGANGQITQTITGGTSPYTYIWSGSSVTTKDRTALSANTYSVTITDSGGCQTTRQYTVTQATSLVVTPVGTNPTCAVTGSIAYTVSGGGGTSPYSFNWSRTSPSGTGSGTGLSITGLVAGSYQLTVTSSAGCTGTSSVVLTQPTPPVVDAFLSHVNCFGNAQGNINQSVTLGSPPYTYIWAAGGVTTKDRSLLAAGNYTVTVSDTKSCSVVKSYTITQPVALTLSNALAQPTCSNGGSINLTAAGGTSPYTYNWQDLSGGSNLKNRSGLQAGNYFVTVTDSKGCTAQTSAVLNSPNCSEGLEVCVSAIPQLYSTDPDPMVTSYTWKVPAGAQIVSGQGTASINVNWANVSVNSGFICVNKVNSCGESADFCKFIIIKRLQVNASVSLPVCNGSDLMLFADGGSKYSWTGPNGYASENVNPVLYNVNSQHAGKYKVTATNAAGCVGVDSLNVTVQDAPLATVTVYNSNCTGYNGYINLSVFGGNGPFNYAWSNGNTTQNNAGLGRGNYWVTVTDANGCKAKENGTVSELNGPSLLLDAQNVDCFDNSTGSISLTVQGGVAPYAYFWSNGSTVQNPSNLKAGTYIVTVVDNNGCAAIESVEVLQPKALKVDMIISNATCYGSSTGAIAVNVEGGVIPHLFAWADQFYQKDRTALPAGTYTLTVTDLNLCTIVKVAQITQPAAALSTTLSSMDITCNGSANGLINLTPAGGTSPYTYNWRMDNFPSYSSTSKNIRDLAPGTYRLTVTDAKGCTSTASRIINSQTPINISKIKTDLSCYKSNNGSIDITASGGISPYQYYWSNGDTSEDLTELAAGSYTLSVQDANGCPAQTQTTITEPTVISYSSQITQASCSGAAGGAISMTVSGGTAPYSFYWSDGGVAKDRPGIYAGSYWVTITDNKGCNAITQMEVSQKDALISEEFVTNVSCNGGSDGAIDFAVRGGTPPYTYHWSTGATTKNISQLQEGAYFVTFTDANLCSSASLIIVNEPNTLYVTTNSSDKKCAESVDGSVTTDVWGGIGPYKYAWSNGASTELIENIDQGTYTVTVTDFKGCTAVSTSNVLFPQKMEIAGVSAPNCPGQNNGTINLSVTLGTSPYTYLWSDSNVTTSNRSGLHAGTYTATVTDANGCTDKLSFDLVPLNISLFSVKPTCSVNDQGIAGPNSDGEIYLTASGGIKPYTINWSNGSNQENINNLPNGFYTVSITSGNCVGTANKLLAAGNCTPPVGVDEYYVTEINVPVAGNVSLNDYDPDFEYPLTLLPLGYIDEDIGIINWDSTYNGQFIFTPATGYIGTFSIPYQICDTLNLCATARLHITVAPPVLGLAKTVSTLPVNNGDQSYSFTYAVKIENLGYINVGNLKVRDNLDSTFAGSVSYNVTDIYSTDFTVNPQFNGSSDKNLLSGANQIAAFSSGFVFIDVRLVPGIKLGPYANSAYVSGRSPGGIGLADKSQDGNDSDPDHDGNPLNNSDPTVILLCPVVSITGDKVICAGGITAVSSVPNGRWISSNPQVAEVNNSGVVVGISAGTASFIFIETISGCVTNETETVTVIGRPEISITGDTIICAGSSTTLTPTSGGVWISGNTQVASVSNNGIVTGKTTGLAQFYFQNLETGCISNASTPISVKNNPLLRFDGDSIICTNTTMTVTPKVNGSWTSSNPLVATINNQGHVTGKSNGVATLSFVTNEGCTRNPGLKVNVKGNTFAQIVGPASICAGTTTNLIPSSGGTWQSSNPSAATVTNSGIVSGIQQGTAYFTFTDNVSGCITEIAQPVTVMPKPIILLTGDSNICVGTSTSFSPSTGGIWIAEDPSIATINNAGLVLGQYQGQTSFTFVQSSNGCASDPSQVITVRPKPDISFNGPETICKDASTNLLPSSGGIWFSNHPEIATINNTGFVTGISQGVVRFYFVAGSTGCTSELSSLLTVNNKPEVAITGNQSICIGATTTLSPTLGGTWSSVNPSIATVNNQGVVTGITAGSTTFVFTAGETGCISLPTSPVTIISPPAISLSGPSTICAGYGTTLSPATGGIWVSENTHIATVSNNGIVKGIAAGKVKFTFTQNSTGCKATLDATPVTVNNCLFDDINSTFVNVPVSGNVRTNDIVPTNTIFGMQPLLISKPAASAPSISMQQNGEYSFVTAVEGNYVYNVQVCIPPVTENCPVSKLEITVRNTNKPGNIPIANPDRATTYAQINQNIPGIPVTLYSLANDQCLNGAGCILDPLSVTIVTPPSNGFTSIDAQGNITYTPQPGFTGADILEYKVCVAGEPQNCSRAYQYIDVLYAAYIFANTTDAMDDFFITFQETTVTGNVKLNDHDKEGNLQTVVAQGSALQPINISGGKYWLDSGGNFTYIPDYGFYGSASFAYMTCDNGAPSACAKATVYILVIEDFKLAVKVYLEGALYNNNNVKTSDGRPLMRDNLRANPYSGQNYIPSTDPYSVPLELTNVTGRYEQKGAGTLQKFKTIADPVNVLGQSGQNAIVDWIFVELRSKTDSTLILATRSGLLQRDGDITDIDGVGGLRFSGIASDSFYVVVRHRNHLGVMSRKVAGNQVLDLTSLSTPLFDFGTTKNNGFDYSGLAAKSNAVPGFRALWAGDFNGDRKLKFVNPDDDQNILFFDVLTHPNNGTAAANFNFGLGYLQGDFDMDGKAKYDNPNDDKNLLFSQILLYPLNTGLLSNFNYFIEQIPPAR